ncbi:MAG: redoxin domain-containing protein [Acidobacteriota bacterium]
MKVRSARVRTGLLAVLTGLLLTACSGEDSHQEADIRLDPPAAPGAMAPNLAPASEGAFMTWLEPAGPQEHGPELLRLSRLVREKGALRWLAPVTVARGRDFFVNWADFPTVEEAADGTLLAHWLARSTTERYSYDVQLARSRDSGHSWSPLGPANRDGTPTEHGFVSMVPEGGGIRLFWLDGRQTFSPKRLAANGSAGQTPAPKGAMTLRTVLVRESLGEEELLDSRVCDCCQTSAARTADGPVVVYRDRSPDEIRDISIIRRTASGWTAPAPVHRDHWFIPGCPVNGPAVASGGENSRHLAVAWFTAPENTPQVLVAFSEDAGVTFSPPVRVDGGRPLGRVSMALDREGHAYVAWLEAGEGDEASVRIRLLKAGSRPSDPVPASFTVSQTSGRRASGFPRLLRMEDHLVVAWTEASDISRVRTKILSLKNLGTRLPAAAEDRPVPLSTRDTGAWRGEKGSPLPSYTDWTLEGEPVALRVPPAKALLINFWATWCGPCRAETPELVDLHHRYSSRGLKVMGISLDGPATADRITKFMADQSIPYTILQDQDGLAYGRFGFQTLPGNFLFNAQGRLVWKSEGALNRHDPALTAALETAMDFAAARSAASQD